MAGIEKCTTIRRMALIYPMHNIAWEGCEVEGWCLLKQVSTNALRKIETSRVENFAKIEGLEVKYQDPSSEDYWEPRLTGYDK